MRAEKQKVLMIAYHFPPIHSVAVRRTLAFVKYLLGYNWNSVVLTVSNPSREVIEYDTLKDIPSEVTVHRCLSYELARFARKVRYKLMESREGVEGTVQNPSKQLSILEKFLYRINKFVHDWVYLPDRKIGWLPFALVKALSIIRMEKISVVYTTSPPHSSHLIGLILNKITKKPWVVDFRDPWTKNLDLFRSDLDSRMKIESAMERSVLRAADGVIVNSDYNRNQLLEQYPFLNNEKVVTINNGYDPEEFSRIGSAKIKCNSQFIMTYTGRIYPGTIEPFFTALAELLENNSDLRRDLRLRIAGIYHRRLLKCLSRDVLKNCVDLLGYVSHKESLSRQAQGDVLLYLLDPNPAARGWIPSKLYEYMRVGNPIFAVVPQGEAATIIKKTRSGVVIDPSNTEGIKSGILKFYKDHKNGGLKCNRDAAEVKKYDIRNQTRQLSLFLSQVASIRGMDEKCIR